jgi:hypothetical protein
MATLVVSGKSHLPLLFTALAESGWTLKVAPEDAALVRNGQKVVLRAGSLERKIRLFAYKVTGSGRQKPYERRIEITSTYPKGSLKRLRAYRDVVVGVDTEQGLFVGVDPRRLNSGGPTGNASSFFDRAGLAVRPHDRIAVRQRRARLFESGVEFHAFVPPSRLAEYLFNYESIHDGTYAGGGPFSRTASGVRGSLSVNVAQGDAVVLVGPPAARAGRVVRAEIVHAFETGNGDAVRRRRVTPEELQQVQLLMNENGRLGEEIVLNHERRILRRARRLDLADRVRWISQESVGEGYDILSYEADGAEKWIEVKSTSGTGLTFEMSDFEWRTCRAAGDKYYLYRVTSVRSASPSIRKARNPHALEAKGLVSKSASGWTVTLR